MIRLIPLIAMLFLAGCAEEVKQSFNDDDRKVFSFKGARYTRANIDGVDCIIGAGNYDTTVAVSCDWTNKKESTYD